MKKIFVALTLAVLIVFSVSLLSAPHVKADSSEAQILSYSWYVAPSTTIQAQYIGDLIVVGEVQNVGTHTLGNVVLGAEAYNASGGFVSSAEFSAYVTYLAPGQKAPFYLDFAPDISQISDISTFDQNWASSVTNVTAQVLNAVDSSQTQYAGLTIPAGSVSNSTSTDTYTVTGTVQNTGDQTTGRVWVIATFYNASGTVVGLNYTNYVSQSLLPGKSATFTATPIDNTAQLSSSITSYTVLIQSDPTPAATSTPTSPITTPTIQPSTSPTSSNQSTASPPIGLSASLIVYLAAIAVIIVLVILTVLLLLRRHRRNAEFDLPPPPPPI